MIVICTGCGEDVSGGAECDCQRSRRARLSRLGEAVATAAAMGRVDEWTLRRAAEALRQKAS